MLFLGWGDLHNILQYRSKKIRRGNGQGRKRGEGMYFHRVGKQNKVGRNKRLKRRGLPLVLPHFIVCPSPAPGQAGRMLSGHGRKTGNFREVFFSSFLPFISTPHLIAHTVPFWMKHAHITLLTSLVQPGSLLFLPLLVYTLNLFVTKVLK